MSNTVNMKYIIPPACEPTVPLLGPYQIAGYAEKIGYKMDIYNFNNFFLQEIIDNHMSEENIIIENELDKIEVLSYRKFLGSFEKIKDYSDLKRELKNCTTTEYYWRLVDYIRCSYDLYSMRFKNLRFRLDGVDSPYRWNIWKDIECFINKFYQSDICALIKKWISAMNISNTQVIGINITFESQLFFAIMVCKLLNELHPDNKIIVGGGFVNSFINSGDSIGPIATYCDFVNAGEGEALIWYLKENGNNMQGLFDKGEKSESRAYYIPAEKICNQKISVCPPTIIGQELDNYFSPLRVLPLRFTYQCYWGKCKFCTDKEYHSCLDSKYNAEEMIDFCVENAKNGDIDCIYFLDSAIPVPIMKKFCKKLIENDVKIKWGTNSRFDPPFVDEEFIELLAKAGCVFIKFGLESGSQHVLDLMDKGTKIENASAIIQLCRKHGILVHTYIMFAFPGETDEDRIETMKFILDEKSHPDNYNCSEFIMYGNSLIAKELNYQLELENMEDEGWHSASYSFSNQHIKEQIRSLRMSFDEKYSPADVLISTGHTIAMAKLLERSSRKITLYRNSILKIHESVVIDYDNRVISKWRRRDGIVFLKDNNAEMIMKLEGRSFTPVELIALGLNTNTLYELINEGILELTNDNPEEILPYEGENVIEFNYGNRFNSLKWYGYYDNN
ncbi:MAG: radical SAM protein [Lachnospiraceae bacterium]|nr:radical SAM protein [Lachnospiraceae bacterium]